jgi:protein phosphatase 1G
MEDAHITLLPFGLSGSPREGLFCVFDGHGGREVALFAQKHFANIVQSSPAFQAGNVAEAMRQGYFKIDEMLRSSEYKSQILRLAGKGDEEEERLESSRVKTGDESGEETHTEATFMRVMHSRQPTDCSTTAGCTAVAAHVRDRTLTIANAGDSRAVRV